MVFTADLPLACTPPFAGTELLAFLARRAVPRVEVVAGSTYRRTLRLAHGPAVLRVELGRDRAEASATVTDPADLAEAAARVAALVDADAPATAIDEHLSSGPLGAAVAACPGRRSPGCADVAELVTRAILGQQISVVAAGRLAAGMTERLGEQLPTDLGADSSLTHLFPTPAAIADSDPSLLPMPRARAATLLAVNAAMADGTIPLAGGRTSEALAAFRGIGPWTTGYVALRAEGAEDVFLPTDVGVRHGLVALGLEGDPKAAATQGQQWSPYRSYALHHLWSLA